MSSLGQDVDFYMDEFGKPTTYSEKDSIAKMILNLLLLKPGNLPSEPFMGVDIRKYLYMREDEIDVNELKNSIYNSCHSLLPYIMGDIKIYLKDADTDDGRKVLILYFPLTIDGVTDSLFIGVSRSGSNESDATYMYESAMNSRRIM